MTQWSAYANKYAIALWYGTRKTFQFRTRAHRASICIRKVLLLPRNLVLHPFQMSYGSNSLYMLP